MLAEENVTFFGRNSFEYIDAGETMEKSWICFMIEVPDDLMEVRSLVLRHQNIVITGDEAGLSVEGDFQNLWK
jgi:hypothetical protein